MFYARGVVMQVSIQRLGSAVARLTLAALTAVFALFGAQAHASTVMPGGSLGDLAMSGEATFGDLLFSGGSILSYEASWSFTLSKASSLDGLLDLISGSLLLSSIAVDAVVDTTPAAFDFGFIGAGAHTLTVKGAMPKGGFDGYVGKLYASPVPEAESLAFLLAGGVALAAVASRKYSATGTSSALR